MTSWPRAVSYGAEHRIPTKDTIVTSAVGSWALVAPPSNVTATFLTGPNAASYQPSGIKIERMGDAPEGFVKYRIVG